MDTIPIYYQKQDNWDMDDFYFLNRNINRMINYRKKMMSEIQSLDLSQMPDITKALLKAHILARPKAYEELIKLDNLKGLYEVKPLKLPLILTSNPTRSIDAFEQMNIWW